MPSNDVLAFHQFLGDRLDSGIVFACVEDALDEWRKSHPLESEDATAAIVEALDDLNNGDQGMSLAEFDRHLQQRHPFLGPTGATQSLFNGVHSRTWMKSLIGLLCGLLTAPVGGSPSCDQPLVALRTDQSDLLSRLKRMPSEHRCGNVSSGRGEAGTTDSCSS